MVGRETQVRVISGAVVLLALAATPTAAPKATAMQVTAPSASEVRRLQLAPFYKKYLSAGGLPIVSSARVSDYALREAGYLVDAMLRRRPDVRRALIAARLRVVVMAYDEFTTNVPEHAHLPSAYWDKRARGLGPGKGGTVVSVGEENLLGYRGDPYPTESIFVHEFAHAIYERGLVAIDRGFEPALRRAYQAAMKRGLWKGKYASRNLTEYWAEITQSWFDTNRENDFDHNHVNTRVELERYDKPAARLLAKVFGNNSWRYTPPDQRLSQAHLRGYSPARAPRFRWPARVLTAFRAYQRGANLTALAPIPLPRLPATRSKQSTTHTRVRVTNRRNHAVRLYWIDWRGSRRLYHTLTSRTSSDQHTYAGHTWLVTDMNDRPLVLFEAAAKPGIITVR